MVRRRRRGTGAELSQIEAVYRRRLGELRRVAAAITGDRENARDVVQDAFVTAVLERSSFRGDGPLDAWLWRIVVNHARSARRAAPARAEAPEAQSGSSNGNAPSGSEVVRAALAALPERQRLILFLRYYADLDYGTIAAIADVAPGTVAATLNAGHRALRGLMEEVNR